MRFPLPSRLSNEGGQTVVLALTVGGKSLPTLPISGSPRPPVPPVSLQG
ncbi:MAG TPA: hypothetical protein IGS52_04415 [Oscillatoriaceae cyanobacterium M33_DOE_052]|nr:hypothetical protein [Oscillatoriaceae cyanobacterium M33_DOE_052]